MIKRVIIRLFDIDVRKPKFDQKSTGWLHQSQDIKKIKEVNNVPKQKIIGSGSIKISNIDEKNLKKKTRENLSKKRTKKILRRVFQN